MGRRLSLLQQTILRLCDEARHGKFRRDYVTTNDVIEAYYKITPPGPGKPRRWKHLDSYFDDYESTHRSSVCRALRRLKERGLVDYNRTGRRGCLVIYRP